MKAKINKIISSKYTASILVVVSILLAQTYAISGAVTLGQHIMFLLGITVVVFILFGISQNITEKSHAYNLNLALIIFWLLYIAKSLIF